MVGPLQTLERKILAKEKEIEKWFAAQWKQSPAPVYGSVDLRNAGFKLAPVDMNLFPAGFNNLNTAFMSFTIEAARNAIITAVPNAKKVLLLPENHTRNIFYWESVAVILKIIKGAGFEVKIGSINPEVTEPFSISLPSGVEVNVSPAEREKDILKVGNFVPDVILLNNDLSAGIPSLLTQLSQPVMPPAQLGWSQRLKSEHFQYYSNVSKEFANFIDIDDWVMSPLFRKCGEVDFMQREPDDCLTKNVAELFAEIEKKYAEYNITEKPFIIVKADAGTYGMAVMTVRSVEELQNLNRKQRTAMSKTKSGQPVTQVIVQEGVYTFETIGDSNAVAEPVVYLWGEQVVGGFYRVHKDREVDENLNSPGMHFEPLPFAKSCHTPNEKDECQNRFYSYGVIARLSMLAAAREMLEQK